MSDIKYYRLVAVEKPLNVLKGAGQLSLSCTYCGKVIDAMGGGCLAVCLDCANSNKLIADILKLEARNKELKYICRVFVDWVNGNDEISIDQWEQLKEAINNE